MSSEGFGLVPACRSAAAFSERLRALAPHYTPEWLPEEDDGAGGALVRVAAHFLETVGERLARVSEKNHLAFLALTGTRPRPPEPARVPLAFTMSKGAGRAVTVPAGTRVAAGGVVFETEQALSVDPCRPCHLIHSRGRWLPPLDLLAETAATQRLLWISFGVVPRVLACRGSGLACLDPAAGARWQAGTDDLDVRRDGSSFCIETPVKGSWLRVQLASQPVALVLEEIAEAPRTLGPIAPSPLVSIIGQEVLGRECAPLGAQPVIGSGFCMRLPDAVVAGCSVRLQITLARPGRPAPDTRLVWEYWNGFSWTAIVDLEDTTQALSRAGEVHFTCPADLAAITLAAHSGRWIRLRLDRGDFGRTRYRVVDQVFETHDDFQPPLIADLALTCRLGARPALEIFAEDDLAGKRALNLPCRPFPAAPDAGLYLCFDRAPQGPSLSLFCRAASAETPFTWAYSTGEGWRPLTVSDETRGLTRDGFLTLLVPEDWRAETFFQKRGWWVRLRGDRTDAGVKAVVPNATLAVQAEQIRDERPERLDARRFRLRWQPVCDVRVRVDGESWREITDSDDDHGDGRVYTLDPVRGLIAFVGSEPGPIRVDYRLVGGRAGNLAAGTITELETTIPFVAVVTNPVASGGGADAEPLAEVVSRGPTVFFHRDRAVTEADYVALAYEASGQVARAFCRLGPDGAPIVTILPVGDDPRPQAGTSLRAEVAAHLGARMPCTLADRLEVRASGYVPVSLVIAISLADPDGAAAVVREARRRLNDFLHPLRGDWSPGERPSRGACERALAGLGSLRVIRLVLGTEQEAPPRRRIPPDHLVCDGRAHQFQFETRSFE